MKTTCEGIRHVAERRKVVLGAVMSLCEEKLFKKPSCCWKYLDDGDW